MNLYQTYEEMSTRVMLSKPKTELASLIGRKWFLSLEKLAEQSGVPLLTIKRALNGGVVTEKFQKKLTEFLVKL